MYTSISQMPRKKSISQAIRKQEMEPVEVDDLNGISENITCEFDGCFSLNDEKKILFTSSEDYRNYQQQTQADNTGEFFASSLTIRDVMEEKIASVKFSSTESMNKFIQENQICKISRIYEAMNSLTTACPILTYESILSNPDVLSINEDTQSFTEEYNGFEIELYMNTDHYEPSYNGETGGLINNSFGGDDIKIALIEGTSPGDGTINCSHIGWLDCQNCPSRIKSTKDCINNCIGGYCNTFCYSTSLVCDSSSTVSGSHGTKVAWVAAGSIEQNQDTNIQNQTEQKKRSGIADESSILYYRFADTACTMKEAIVSAINDGADVINISAGLLTSEAGLCNINANPCDINSAITMAFQQGVVIVKSAGNNGGSVSGCNVTHPGVRRDLLTVGSLSTTGKMAQTVGYNDTDVASSSSEGYAIGSLYQGGSTYVPLIDLVAPGEIINNFSNGTNQYENSIVSAGTSFAAPMVAATVGLTREWTKDVGWTSTPNNAGLLMAVTLLYGDGFNSIASPDDCATLNEESSFFISETLSAYSTGYGRIKAHFASSSDMGNNFTWNTRSTKIYQGATVSWNVGSTSPDYAQGFKASLIWNDSDFQNIPKLELSVYNTCPTQGGEELVLAAHPYSMRQRLILYPDQINGKCLQVRVKGVSVPPGGADFWAASHTWTLPNSGAHLHLQNNTSSGPCF